MPEDADDNFVGATAIVASRRSLSKAAGLLAVSCTAIFFADGWQQHRRPVVARLRHCHDHFDSSDCALVKAAQTKLGIARDRPTHHAADGEKCQTWRVISGANSSEQPSDRRFRIALARTPRRRAFYSFSWSDVYIASIASISSESGLSLSFVPSFFPVIA